MFSKKIRIKYNHQNDMNSVTTKLKMNNFQEYCIVRTLKNPTFMNTQIILESTQLI